MNQLPVKVINLKERPDRLEHILREFQSRQEFRWSIVHTERKKNGRRGLWDNLLKVVRHAKKIQMPYIIFCEDDHLFTRSYNYETLSNAIKDADRYRADLLLGGVSWFDNAFQINKKLFWVSQFTGLQFSVIYARFYDVILGAEFGPVDVADIKLSELSRKKFVIHPFISIQKEFGYSDITTKNNQAGYIKRLFRSSSITLHRLKKVRRFYIKIEEINSRAIHTDFSEISIPTYIINHSNNPEINDSIKVQFDSKPEFDISTTFYCQDNDDKASIWKCLQLIVQTAIDAEDDVIIVCHSSIRFSSNYNKHNLIKNIIASNEIGAHLLLANALNLEQIVPLTKELHWFSEVENSNFYVIYASLFQKILAYKFRKGDEVFKILSSLSSHKLLLYPFITESLNHNNVNRTHANDETKLASLSAAMIEMGH